MSCQHASSKSEAFIWDWKVQTVRFGAVVTGIGVNCNQQQLITDHVASIFSKNRITTQLKTQELHRKLPHMEFQ